MLWFPEVMFNVSICKLGPPVSELVHRFSLTMIAKRAVPATVVVSAGSHRTPSGDDAIDTDIFVQIGPMNTLVFADPFPSRPLLDRSVEQPGILRQRDGYGPAVRQIKRQGVFADGYIDACYNRFLN